MNRLFHWFRNSGWRIFLIIIIITSFLLATISILIFILKFRNSEISTDPQRWGEFGDYFAGTISTLVAIVNVCVTIWLTIIVNRFSARNTDRQIAADRQAALIQLRHEALKEFRSDLTKCVTAWQMNIFDPRFANACVTSITNFMTNYEYLFDKATMDACFDLISLIVSGNSAFKSQNGDLLEELVNTTNTRKDTLISAIGRRVIS